MIDSRDLEVIVALSLCSGHLANEKPVSLMIVSDKCEAGKTSVLEKYSKTDGIAYLTDATAYGLWRDFHKDIASGKLHHILIPEMITPLSRNVDTVNTFVSTLGSLIEEGIAEIHTGFLDPIKLESPVTVGVIGCMPRPIFNMNKLRWESTGFLSRFIVVTYKHSQETVEKIFESIIKGNHLTENNIELPLPTGKINVTIPEYLARKCVDFSRDISKQAIDDGKLYGYREAKNMLRLLSSHVIYDNIKTGNKRLEATDVDFDAIVALSYLLTDRFNALNGDKQND